MVLEDGTPVIERRIEESDLTPAQRAAAHRAAGKDRIELIEQVYAPGGRYVEVYVQRGSALDKIELR